MARTQKRVQEGNQEEKVSPSKCAIYLDECPIQEKIPIYLIVFGAIQMTINLISDRCIKNDLLKKGIDFLRLIIIVFLFCWFIAGNVWVYSIYQPSYNKNATDVSSYCNKTLYLFAFWSITVYYIILGPLLLVIGLCGLCCFSQIKPLFSDIIPFCNSIPADNDISGNSAGNV